MTTLQTDVLSAKGRDANLADRQELDTTVAPIIAYHQDGTLPTDEQAAR